MLVTLGAISHWYPKSKSQLTSPASVINNIKIYQHQSHNIHQQTTTTSAPSVECRAPSYPLQIRLWMFKCAWGSRNGCYSSHFWPPTCTSFSISVRNLWPQVLSDSCHSSKYCSYCWPDTKVQHLLQPNWLCDVFRSIMSASADLI